MDPNLGPFWSQVGPQNGARSVQDGGREGLRNSIDFGIDLGGVLGRSGRPNLEAKTAPGRPQTCPGARKKDAKRGPKYDSGLEPVSDPILDRFWEGLWGVWGPILEGSETDFPKISGWILGGLRATTAGPTSNRDAPGSSINCRASAVSERAQRAKRAERWRGFAIHNRCEMLLPGRDLGPRPQQPETTQGPRKLKNKQTRFPFP